MRIIRNPFFLVGGLGVFVGAAFLAFQIFGVHTLFFDKVVDEQLPFGNISLELPDAALTATASDTSEPGASPPTAAAIDSVAAASDTAQTDTSAHTTSADSRLNDLPSDDDQAGLAGQGDLTEDTATAENAESGSRADDLPATTDSDPSPEAVDKSGPSDNSSPDTETTGPVLESVGSFISLDHPAEGQALVISDTASGQRILRLQDFKTDNGPDLFVYLSGGTNADNPDHSTFDDDFINLGTLKGNIGDQNYELDPGVDVDHYSTVVIWCRRFTVAFAAAEMTAAS